MGNASAGAQAKEAAVSKETAASDRIWLVTANELLTGDIVYRTSAADQADGGWSRDLAAAAAFAKDGADVAVASARADLVVGAQLAPAEDPGVGAPRFHHLRDRIRAEGPTVAYGEAALEAAPTVAPEAALAAR